MQDFITFKNAQIAYSSEGKGTTVVLLHGFLENSTMWNSISESLLQRNRVVTIDLLGHGSSDSIGYVHTMENFADAIEAVLKHLKIRKYILVGHSLGGYVALALAEKSPEKLKGFCLMNSTSLPDDDDRKLLRARANKMVQNNFTNMVRMSFTNLFSEQSRTVYKSEMEFALQEALKTPLQGYIAGQEGMRLRTDKTAILQGLSCKKLLIIGKKDPVLDFETSVNEAKNTNSETVIFNDGHMSHIENKGALSDILKNFLRSC